MANTTYFLPNGQTTNINTVAVSSTIQGSEWQNKQLQDYYRACYDATKSNYFDDYAASIQSWKYNTYPAVPASTPQTQPWKYDTYPAEPAIVIKDGIIPSIPFISTVYKPILPTEAPNKMANADPRWENKSAWGSAELDLRQQRLVTYSAEVATLFDIVNNIIGKLIGEKVFATFIVNFGSPVVNNEQQISVNVSQPFPLAIMVTRALTNGQLSWSAKVSSTADTPLVFNGRALDLRDAGEVSLTSIAVTGTKSGNQQTNQERKRRVIKI